MPFCSFCTQLVLMAEHEHEAVFHQAQQSGGLLRDLIGSAPVSNALSMGGQPHLGLEHLPFCQRELFAGIVHPRL